jgi:hypothetical protein
MGHFFGSEQEHFFNLHRGHFLALALVSALLVFFQSIQSSLGEQI